MRRSGGAYGGGEVGVEGEEEKGAKAEAKRGGAEGRGGRRGRRGRGGGNGGGESKGFLKINNEADKRGKTKDKREKQTNLRTPAYNNPPQQPHTLGPQVSETLIKQAKFPLSSPFPFPHPHPRPAPSPPSHLPPPSPSP